MLSNPTGGAVLGARVTATVSIADNDVGIQFQFATGSVIEDGGTIVLGIFRGDDGTLPVTVNLFTTDLTAKSGLDYTGVTNTLSGFMAYRMACESADLIAGIASLAGMTPLDSSLCQPSQPVNIVHIHGTADATVPYAGGALGSPLFKVNMPAFPGALQTVQTWAGYNSSTGPVTEPAPTLDLTTDMPGLDTVVTRYTESPPCRGALKNQIPAININSIKYQ